MERHHRRDFARRLPCRWLFLIAAGAAAIGPAGGMSLPLQPIRWVCTVLKGEKMFGLVQSIHGIANRSGHNWGQTASGRV
jgi:hypothetical protein